MDLKNSGSTAFGSATLPCVRRRVENEKIQTGKKVPENQLDLFARAHASAREPGKITHPALERLKTMDLNTMTPLDAMNALNELKGIKEA